MSLSDETQFQTDNISRILKSSCPTAIGHLSRIKKEIALEFGSRLPSCPRMTEKAKNRGDDSSLLTPTTKLSFPSLRAEGVAISLFNVLMKIKNHCHLEGLSDKRNPRQNLLNKCRVCCEQIAQKQFRAIPLIDLYGHSLRSGFKMTLSFLALAFVLSFTIISDSRAEIIV